jgi:hypothetical protein
MLTLLDRSRTRQERQALGTWRRLRATAISVGLHALLLLGLWQVLQFPRVVASIFDPSEPRAVREQRIRFVAVAPPRAVEARREPERARTAPPGVPPEGPPVAGVVPSAPPPVIAPAEVPSGIPAPPAGPTVTGPTTGPLASGRGPVRGIQPGYSDPRIWVEPPVVSAPALEGEEKLDSAITSRITAYRDSVATYAYQPNKFERADWTYTTKDGKKYGIDPQFIRLGRVSIPTALLGLLPFNQAQANPIALDRQRRLDQMRGEILLQAQQAMNEEEFRRAVKQIRERKERERKEAEKKKKKEEVKTISGQN